MTPDWVDRSVFYLVEQDGAPIAPLDDLLRLGFNALCVPAGTKDLDALIRSAHDRDVHVCVVAGRSDPEIDRWLARGVDGVLATQLVTRSGNVPRLRSGLFYAEGHRCYFDGHGFGDFGPFWRAFNAAHGTSPMHVALFSSERGEPSLGTGREPDEVEVALVFLMAWPIVPFVRAGDERGVESALERLTYLRLTEPDLAPAAPLELLSEPSPGYPLVFRRGTSVLVAVNASASAHSIELPPVGDATPIAARHCHLVHADGRWCARLAPAGYGIFGVT